MHGVSPNPANPLPGCCTHISIRVLDEARQNEVQRGAAREQRRHRVHETVLPLERHEARDLAENERIRGQVELGPDVVGRA